ncbi:hypothetical protein [Roseimaritima sediminicola]|uniref:hypothetical protein n=1 Tax=Roseimaritima sediminicola TaxID=2662066 RepID=UPI001F36A99C|nr:hypothetical protein [Roseimaritima sediminicola]
MTSHRDSIRRDRRAFLETSLWGVAASGVAISGTTRTRAAEVTERAGSGDLPTRPPGVQVLMPRDRVPLSFIIDDSTCLVNMGHFCTPQFAAAWPGRAEYQKPWQTWPREIPDAFVRRFGQWCAQHGVKGKYSIVPNPACVGWLDRVLPGWSRRDVQNSLKLVRELMVPNWDIHPEMITHTRVIDLKTGRPMQEISAATMENSYPQEKKSVDELAAYLAYSLRILKNCDLPCEGVTTPGGFGNAVKSELPLAVDQAVRDVYGVDLPHYFKYVISGDESTEPKLEYLRGQGTDDVRVTVNVPAGTGDWFGGWQGDVLSQADRYCDADASSGRMVELIEQRQPAVMLCHWPGMYSNGSEEGFHAFQRVVRSLASRFADDTVWMKVSEIGRYWAAKQLTEIRRTGNRLTLSAPFATEKFTVRVAGGLAPVSLRHGDGRTALRKVATRSAVDAGTWFADEGKLVACFDLPKGESQLELGTL